MFLGFGPIFSQSWAHDYEGFVGLPGVLRGGAGGPLTPTPYQYDHENLFLDPEIIQLWGLDGPGGPRNHSERRGAKRPHFGWVSGAPGAGQTSKTQPKNWGQTAFRYPEPSDHEGQASRTAETRDPGPTYCWGNELSIKTLWNPYENPIKTY